MIDFSQAVLSEVWEEALPLMRDHFAETGDFDISDFSPNGERYFAMDRMGFCKTFVARFKADLVGYCLIFILPHQHAEHKIWAAQDALFLKKRYRGIGGYRFIEWVDEALKEMGANLIFRPVSVRNDYSRTLSHMGYEHVESGYLRRI